jgi:hypothetical protein
VVGWFHDEGGCCHRVHATFPIEIERVVLRGLPNWNTEERVSGWLMDSTDVVKFKIHLKGKMKKIRILLKPYLIYE